MPTITAIKRQIKNPQRLNIYLDGTYSFSLALETAVSHRLKPNLQLTDDQIRVLMGDGEQQRIWENVQKFISLRPRSEREIDQWFKRKQVPDAVITPLKDKLHRLELINDQQFASWWVEQRLNFRPRGQQALRFELQTKGISSDIIAKVLSQLPDQHQTIKHIAERKLATLQRFDPRQQKQKLAAFLQRRGYTYSQIKPVIDELCEKTYT